MRLPARIVVLVGLLMACAGTLLWYAPPHKDAPFPETISALRETLHDRIKKEGPAAAYASFKEEFAQKNFETGHNAAHVMGEVLFEERGVPGVAVCDTSFNFGCYHGFFTSAVAGKGLEVVSALDAACTLGAEGASACQHGIGHGILEYLGHAHLEEALAACARTNQPDPLAGCTGGVFMEYNVPLVANEDGTFTVDPRPLPSTQDPYAPCPTLSSAPFQRSCFQELPQWWQQVFTGGFKQMGEFCNAVADSQNKEACFGGIAKLLPSTVFYEVDAAERACRELPVEWYDTCIMNSAWAFKTNVGKSEDAQRLCAFSSASMQSRCPQ